MKSFDEWKQGDPEWDQLKYVWGSGNKHVDMSLVNKMRLKVQAITDQYIRDLNDPNIKNLRELPPAMRDSLAQSIVVATLKAFYSELGSDVTGGRGVFNQQKLGKFQNAAPLNQPQDNAEAPSGWKG